MSARQAAKLNELRPLAEHKSGKMSVVMGYRDAAATQLPRVLSAGNTMVLLTDRITPHFWVRCSASRLSGLVICQQTVVRHQTHVFSALVHSMIDPASHSISQWYSAKHGSQIIASGQARTSQKEVLRHC